MKVPSFTEAETLLLAHAIMELPEKTRGPLMGKISAVNAYAYEKARAETGESARPATGAQPAAVRP